MKTNLMDLAKEYGRIQFVYATAEPPLPWKERDKAWNDLADEIKRVEQLLDKN
jgi:hypothetical protein